jgi:hypothetical protein
MRPAVDLPQPQRTGPPGAPAPPTRTSGIGTLWLVLGVLAAFAIAGYFLMNR